MESRGHSPGSVIFVLNSLWIILKDTFVSLVESAAPERYQSEGECSKGMDSHDTDPMQEHSSIPDKS